GRLTGLGACLVSPGMKGIWGRPGTAVVLPGEAAVWLLRCFESRGELREGENQRTSRRVSFGRAHLQIAIEEPPFERSVVIGDLEAERDRHASHFDCRVPRARHRYRLGARRNREAQRCGYQPAADETGQRALHDGDRIPSHVLPHGEGPSPVLWF